MCKQRHQAVPAAHPANFTRLPAAARRILHLTARQWLPAALLRLRSSEPRPDERVRLSGEW
jgi:hypothetical protein